MKKTTGNPLPLWSSFAAAFVLVAVTASPVQASSQTWAATGDGDWNTGGSWGGTPVPGASGTSGGNTDVATFGNSGTGTHTVSDSVTNRMLGKIIFSGSTGATGSYTIGSSLNTIYFNDYNVSGGTTSNISVSAGNNNETIASNLMITGANNSITSSDLRVQTFDGYTGTLTLSGNIAASTGTPGTISGLRIVTSASASTTPGDNSSNVIVLSGNITDGTGKVAVSHARNGILVLSGVNTFSGGFQLGADNNDGLSANSITEIGVDSVGSANNVTSGAFGTGTLTIDGGVITSNSSANRAIDNTFFVPFSTTLYTGLSSATTGSLIFAGNGTINNANFTVNTSTPTTFSGVLANGASAGSLSKSGNSTLTLSGANTYTGSTSVFSGTLTVSTGGAIDNANAASGALTVSSANNATLNVTGGVVNVNGGLGNNIFDVGTGAGAGVVALSSGTINVTGWTYVGNGSAGTGTSTGGYGSFDMSGGTANFGGYFALNRTSGGQTNSAGTGILNMTGGAINVTSGAFDVGAFADPTAAGSRGVATVSGGTVTLSGTSDGGHADIYVGEFSYGILNLSGSGVIQDNVAAYGMTVGAHTGATGIVNLNGGTLAVPYINTGTNTATVSSISTAVCSSRLPPRPPS